MTEEHDIKWAAEMILKAKKVRRRIWVRAQSVSRETSAIRVHFSDQPSYFALASFTPEDLLATDWEIAP